jgi:hypothetical protein
VLIEPPLPIDPIATWEVRVSFGKPVHTYQFSRYTILVFNKNLLNDLVPSLPPPPPTSASTPTPTATATVTVTATPTPRNRHVTHPDSRKT